MSIFGNLFGPGRKDVWNQLAQELQAEYDEGGFLEKESFRYQYKDWELVLDLHDMEQTYASEDTTGQHYTTYTRLRAPFYNPLNLHFRITHEGFFTPIGKFLGMQDIQIGYPHFDKRFLIKGNHEGKIQELFQDENLQDLLHKYEFSELIVLKDSGWFSRSYPEHVNVLSFDHAGVIKDMPTLKNMFATLEALLDRMVEIEVAAPDKPDFTL
ncbi:MAG: hypothetical protein AAFY71_16370 [Bacteroidota bacterium]